jgi:hypothetical protein
MMVKPPFLHSIKLFQAHTKEFLTKEEPLIVLLERFDKNCLG